MYVKTTARKTKSGTVRYLHLAHNEWDPVAGRSVPKILYGFGRADQLDRDAVKRLVGSLSRLLDPAEALAAIERLMPVADVIKVGRWNHSAEANRIDWRAFAVEVSRRLKAAGKPHLLKRGLAELVE